MANIILILLLVVLVICTVKKPIYGIMCYYGIRMVIPSVSRVASLSFNTVSLGVLLLFLLPHLAIAYNRSGRRACKYIKSITFIMVGIFVLTLFGSLPYGFQWSALLQMFITELVPSVLLALFLQKYRDYKLIVNIVCMMALCTALYGIYTYIAADNPIYTLFNNTGDIGNDLEGYATKRLGMEGIAVGIYNDKIALSLISLLLLTFLINKTEISNPFLLLTVILTFVDMFLTTQRTALFGLIFFFAIMLFDKQDKLIKKYLKASLVLLLVVPFFIDFEVFFNALFSIVFIFDDAMQEELGIGGSSTAMRLMQFINGISYLGFENLLQGEGYNFPGYYYEYIHSKEVFGLDSDFYGFESFLLKIIVSSGILGVGIWTIGLGKMYKALFGTGKTKYYLAFFCSYLLSIIMTDASASFYLFFFLCVLNSKKMDLINIHSCVDNKLSK